MTIVGLANPYLRCERCGVWVTGYRRGSMINVPCGCHAGISSACPSWSPVDGCRCGDDEHPEPVRCHAPLRAAFESHPER